MKATHWRRDRIVKLVLMKMGIVALKKEAGRDFGLVRISLPNPQESVNEHTFHFELDRERLRRALRREGRYLLRSNMQAISPETVWESYLPPNESIGGI